jgi:hypothetical protein
MALTVCAASFSCPCPPPKPSSKMALHCSFTVLTDGTTLHCVLLSLQCFRHFEKVKDAFTQFPGRHQRLHCSRVGLRLSRLPCRPLQPPKPQRFLTSSRLRLSRLPCRPLQPPKPQRFLTSWRLRLSRLPCRPLQPPKPQRFPTSSTTLCSSHNTSGVCSCEEAFRDIASVAVHSRKLTTSRTIRRRVRLSASSACAVFSAHLLCRQGNSDWNRFPCASGCLKSCRRVPCRLLCARSVGLVRNFLLRVIPWLSVAPGLGLAEWRSERWVDQAHRRMS